MTWQAADWQQIPPSQNLSLLENLMPNQTPGLLFVLVAKNTKGGSFWFAENKPPPQSLPARGSKKKIKKKDLKQWKIVSGNANLAENQPGYLEGGPDIAPLTVFRVVIAIPVNPCRGGRTYAFYCGWGGPGRNDVMTDHFHKIVDTTNKLEWSPITAELLSFWCPNSNRNANLLVFTGIAH